MVLMLARGGVAGEVGRARRRDEALGASRVAGRTGARGNQSPFRHFRRPGGSCRSRGTLRGVVCALVPGGLGRSRATAGCWLERRRWRPRSGSPADHAEHATRPAPRLDDLSWGARDLAAWVGKKLQKPQSKQRGWPAMRRWDPVTAGAPMGPSGKRRLLHAPGIVPDIGARADDREFLERRIENHGAMRASHGPNPMQPLLLKNHRIRYTRSTAGKE